MSFPRHASYKDSKVGWLGQIPAHWEVKAIKWISPVLRGASPRPIDDQKYFDDDGEYAWVRIADSSASNGTLLETTQRLSDLGSSLSVKLHPGELFVSIAGTVGKPCISGIKCCIHDGFVYFPRLAIDPAWLYRLFEQGACYAGLGKMGTQLNLNTDTIGSIRIGVPPVEELKAIMKFVDVETAKIDTLVEEQRRLIELLKEKRQAVISQAVTKGLNPNVPMKDSRVEWLGAVPAHWDLGALRRYAKCASGSGISAGELEGEADDQHGIPVIGGNGLMGFTHEASIEQMVLAVGRVGALCGNVHIVSPPSWITDNALVVRPSSEHFRLPYIAAVLRARGLNDIAAKTAQPLITGTQVMDQRVPRPPLDEQDAIVSFVDKHATDCDRLIAESAKATLLLQERRSALISAAVTGKIDVRGLVPQPEAVAA